MRRKLIFVCALAFFLQGRGTFSLAAMFFGLIPHDRLNYAAIKTEKCPSRASQQRMRHSHCCQMFQCFPRLVRAGRVFQCFPSFCGKLSRKLRSRKANFPARPQHWKHCRNHQSKVKQDNSNAKLPRNEFGWCGASLLCMAFLCLLFFFPVMFSQIKCP